MSKTKIPCPFCNSIDIVQIQKNSHWYANCSKCGCLGPERDTAQAARISWEARTISIWERITNDEIDNVVYVNKEHGDIDFEGYEISFHQLEILFNIASNAKEQAS